MNQVIKDPQTYQFKLGDTVKIFNHGWAPQVGTINALFFKADGAEAHDCRVKTIEGELIKLDFDNLKLVRKADLYCYEELGGNLILTEKLSESNQLTGWKRFPDHDMTVYKVIS